KNQYEASVGYVEYSQASNCTIDRGRCFQEKLLKENIAQAPNNAHLYGNYGQFLMCQGRFREAVVQWEKALSIASYPRAVEQLAKAKLFVAQNKKEGDCACGSVKCH